MNKFIESIEYDLASGNYGHLNRLMNECDTLAVDKFLGVKRPLNGVENKPKRLGQ